MSVRTAAAGTAIVVVVGALLYGLGTELLERSPSDTDMPRDPFESNEPRVVDCVADWRGSPDITADVYREVGDGTHEGRSDYTNQEDLDRSPYTWSTTAVTGDIAVIDMYLSAPSSGMCAIWVDGEFVTDDPVTVIVDEEGADNGDDITSYYCGIEVTIS